MKGFTLIEMLVVVAIIGILSGIVFVNFRGNERQVALDNAAAKVVQDIRRVRELALRAQDFECSPGVKVTSFAIHFDDRPDPVNNPRNAKYTIYGNCDSQLEFEEGVETTMETIKYSEFTSADIKTIEVFPGGNPQEHTAFVVTPPNPDIVFSPHSGAASVQLEIGYDSSQKKTITITNTGTVKVE